MLSISTYNIALNKNVLPRAYDLDFVDFETSLASLTSACCGEYLDVWFCHSNDFSRLDSGISLNVDFIVLEKLLV